MVSRPIILFIILKGASESRIARSLSTRKLPFFFSSMQLIPCCHSIGEYPVLYGIEIILASAAIRSSAPGRACALKWANVYLDGPGAVVTRAVRHAAANFAGVVASFLCFPPIQDPNPKLRHTNTYTHKGYGHERLKLTTKWYAEDDSSTRMGPNNTNSNKSNNHSTPFKRNTHTQDETAAYAHKSQHRATCVRSTKKST